MRIAMVSEQASPITAADGVDAGGCGGHVEALCRAIARAGHEVRIYTRRDGPDLPAALPLADGVIVEQLPAGPPRPLAADELLPHLAELGDGLAKAFALVGPDVVHAHFWLSGLAAVAATRGTAVPVVQTFHSLGGTARGRQGRLDVGPPARIRLEAALAREAAQVIATSTEEASELLRIGASRGALTVVPSGVDTSRFSPDGPVAPRTDRHRVVSVGRLVPRNGFATVVRAMVAVPDTELLIAAGPSKRDLAGHPEARRLQRLADRLGVADRVRLLGVVPPSDLPALLRSADVAVCAAWYEPSGTAALEAMACGVPVIGTAVGGILDTVVDASTGLLVPPRRPDLLAVKLRQLLADPFWREAYGAAGVDRARSRYTWERVAAATLAVYRREVAPSLDVLDPVDAAEAHGDEEPLGEADPSGPLDADGFLRRRLVQLAQADRAPTAP